MNVGMDGPLFDRLRAQNAAKLPPGLWKCVFTPDGRGVVTGSDTDMLRLFDPATGRETRSFRGVVGSGTYPVAFSADGKYLASHSRDWDDHSLHGLPRFL